MPSAVRRSLSALAALALVVGSVLIASPAQAVTTPVGVTLSDSSVKNGATINVDWFAQDVNFGSVDVILTNDDGYYGNFFHSAYWDLNGTDSNSDITVTGLTPGLYLLQVQVAGGSYTGMGATSLTIEPADVSITSPAQDSYQPDGAITVAGVVDTFADHAVLLDGATPIATLGAGPFSFSHDFVTDIDHYLTLTAYDAANAVIGQATSHFVFGTPQFTITSPVGNGGTYHVVQYAAFDFDVTLSDPDGVTFWIAAAYDSVTQAQVQILGAGIGGGPYSNAHMSVDTDSLPVGSYNLAIGGHDSTGAPAAGASFTLVVDPPVNPTAVFTSPGSAAVYGPSATVTIAANVTSLAPGVSWVLDIDGSPFDSGSGHSASSSLSTAGLTEGPHTITLTATDDDGRIGTGTQTFNVDATGPTIVVTSPAAAVTFLNPVTVPSVSYSVNLDPATVNYQIYVDSSPWTSGTTGGTVSFSLNTTGWTDGEYHNIYVWAQDAYGNASDVYTLIAADRVAPYSVTIDSPAAGTVTGASLYVQGSAGDSVSPVANVRVDVFKVNATTGNCNAASLGHQDFTPSGGWWDGTLDLSLLPSNDYCFQATATDGAGNTAKSSKIKPITVDTTAPTVPTPLTIDWVENPSILDWTNSTDAHGPVTYEARYGDDGPDLETSSTVWATGLTQSKLTLGADLHPGGWAWQVRAKDAVGNYSAWSAVTTINVIGKPVITQPTCGCSYAAGDDVDVEWTDVWAPGNVHHFVVKFTNGGDSFTRNVFAPDTSTEPETTWVGPFPAWAPDGDWTIRVRAIYNDPFDGSTDGPWSDPVTVHYDGHGPAAPELVAPLDGFQTNNDHVTLEWEAPEPDVAQYILHWNKTGNTGGAGLLSGSNFAPVGDDTSYDFASLNDGTYYWQLMAIDDAGNLGEWSEIWSGTVDTVAPDQVSLLSLLDHTTTTSKNITFTWSPIPDADSYEIEVSPTSDLALDGSLVDGGSQYPTSASKSVTNVPNGTYYWHVRAFDAVGNTGEWSELWTVKVAVPAPVVGGHSIADTGTGDDADDPEPSATPTPEPSESSEPAPSDTPTAQPSESAAPVAASDSDDSGFPVGWIIVIVVVALVGGGLLIRFLVVRAR